MKQKDEALLSARAAREALNADLAAAREAVEAMKVAAEEAGRQAAATLAQEQREAEARLARARTATLEAEAACRAEGKARREAQEEARRRRRRRRRARRVPQHTTSALRAQLALKEAEQRAVEGAGVASLVLEQKLSSRLRAMPSAAVPNTRPPRVSTRRRGRRARELELNSKRLRATIDAQRAEAAAGVARAVLAVEVGALGAERRYEGA